MKNLLFIAAFLLVFPVAIFAQAAAAPAAPDADPADVGSIDAIMKATYDVISGDAGEPRNWDRFRSLFYTGARLIPVVPSKDAPAMQRAVVLTPEDYVKMGDANFAKEGFFEREKARRVEVFGNIAHVFSTYEAFKKKDDKEPFLRGINSFQLVNDGKRWYVMTIFWQAESKTLPLPKEYLRSKK